MYLFVNFLNLVALNEKADDEFSQLDMIQTDKTRCLLVVNKLSAEPPSINSFFVCLFTPQYKQNPEMFKQTAKLWSHVYAGAPVSSPEYTRKIDKLCAMGFEKVSMP